MSYTVSTDAFRSTFALSSDGTKLTHHSGKRFKLFPFNTTQQSTSPAVESLDQLIGYYLSLIEGIEPQAIPMDTLIDRMKAEVEIEPGSEGFFQEAVSQLFFEDGQLRALNLKMREYIPCDEQAAKRIAEYLVDVLGDREHLQNQVKYAMQALAQRSNVLESFVISKLEATPGKPLSGPRYVRITTALKTVFEQDFEYVLTSEVRTRDYLLPLLEFYYFTYTAQACLQLDRLCDGDPTVNRPLYFSLEWEKTSQSRRCFSEGWKLLEPALGNMFAHVITLEILNQVEENERFDYVKLAQMAARSPEEDESIGGQIHQLSTLYRNAISDCAELSSLVPKTSPNERTVSEIRFLFKSVRTQFEMTDRRKPYVTYAEKFERFCKQKYLKRRGRSGPMLNISEETLIFLTKICVREQELMRLNDVFFEFERRGVFLDQNSKEQVAQYFEKLNLIEKKSDSGDAKYVKRIL